MQTHRFAAGETVLFAEKRHSHFTWKAPYTIIACIRTDAAEPQYKIASAHRSAHRDEIRTAGEHELCRTPQPLAAVRQSSEQFLENLTYLQPANLNFKNAAETPLTPWLQHSGGRGHHV